MEILLTHSRNGSLSCSKDSISLHSTFNPEKEAERFVSLLEVSYNPSFIIITGPCLGYTEPFLRKRFPKSTIISIQYSSEFEEYSKRWDYSFYLQKITDADILCDNLFSLIGEEKLFSTFFISWKPSEKAWPEPAASLWIAFKNLLTKAESIISTRDYFNRRWFLNTIRFFCSVKKVSLPPSKRTDKPIIITASGPSLYNSLSFLKKHRKTFLLMAVSSSILPLIENDIKPDFCITTDGGWWAKKHLEPLIRNGISVPIIAAPESSIPSEILNNGTIIPLSYSDFPDNNLFKVTSIPHLFGERNGTVSGTAAMLALTLTSGKIFFCGLDLASSKEYQHTQPNALELINSLSDDRLKTIETRCVPSSFQNSTSLGIYRNWFSSRNENFYNRVFRLVTAKDNLEPIPRLHDIYIDSEIPKCFINDTTENQYADSIEVLPGNNAKLIFDFLIETKHEIETTGKNEYNENWYKMAALKEIILSERKGCNTISTDIQEKASNLLDEGILIAKKLLEASK